MRLSQYSQIFSKSTLKQPAPLAKFDVTSITGKEIFQRITKTFIEIEELGRKTLRRVLRSDNPQLALREVNRSREARRKPTVSPDVIDSFSDESTISVLRVRYGITNQETQEEKLNASLTEPSSAANPRRRDIGKPDPIENRAAYNRMEARLARKRKEARIRERRLKREGNRQATLSRAQERDRKGDPEEVNWYYADLRGTMRTTVRAGRNTEHPRRAVNRSRRQRRAQEKEATRAFSARALEAKREKAAKRKEKRRRARMNTVLTESLAQEIWPEETEVRAARAAKRIAMAWWLDREHQAEEQRAEMQEEIDKQSEQKRRLFEDLLSSTCPKGSWPDVRPVLKLLARNIDADMINDCANLCSFIYQCYRSTTFTDYLVAVHQFVATMGVTLVDITSFCYNFAIETYEIFVESVSPFVTESLSLNECVDSFRMFLGSFISSDLFLHSTSFS